MYEPCKHLWSAVITNTLEDIWYEKANVCDACVAVADANWAIVCERAGVPHAEEFHRTVMGQLLPKIAKNHYKRAQRAQKRWLKESPYDITREQRVMRMFAEAKRLKEMSVAFQHNQRYASRLTSED